MALAFASGVDAYLPSASAKEPGSKLPPEFQSLFANPQLSPGLQNKNLENEIYPFKSSKSPFPAPPKALQNEIHSYNLLKQADAYLQANNRSRIELNTPIKEVNSHQAAWDLEEQLFNWVRHIGSETTFPAGMERAQETGGSKHPALDDSKIAIKTVNEALKHTGSVVDHRNLELNFIASHILSNAGDQEGAKKCALVTEKIIRSYQTTLKPEETAVNAIVTVLSTRACKFVPLDISDLARRYQSSFTLTRKVSTAEIANAESIWLRIAAIADKLESTSHTRRIIHRNLSLCYKAIGKRAEAEHQKQILFSLVGRKDDSLLYPVDGGCGQALWWTVNSHSHGGRFCGMG